MADRYRLLARLAFLASSSLDLDEVLLRMAEELHPLLGCDQFRLLSRDGEGRFQQRTVNFHPEVTLKVPATEDLSE